MIAWSQKQQKNPTDDPPAPFATQAQSGQEKGREGDRSNPLLAPPMLVKFLKHNHSVPISFLLVSRLFGFYFFRRQRLM